MGKPTIPHQSYIDTIKNDFDEVWDRIRDTDEEILLKTEDGHDFIPEARYCKDGKHPDEPVIVIYNMDDVVYARIYQCCWRHISHCSKTWIGGYSKALDKWVQNL